MSILQIEEAARAGARLVFGFAGETNTGKTLSALYFAYGLANYNSKKIGFLCTENRRGRLYHDKLPNKEKFWIADLQPPFTPERYISAIDEMMALKIEVLIIDTVSHEWSGIGGCLDIAKQMSNKSAKWAKVKQRHGAFVNHMLQTPMHIVCGLRAKEKSKVVMERDETGEMKQVYKPMGVQPIQEANFMFEMTASLLMHDQGTRQTILKCPADLKPMLGRGTGYITAEDGKRVREWLEDGGTIDPEIDRWRDIVILTAGKGTKELQKVWEGEVPKNIKSVLGREFIAVQKEAAKEADYANKEVLTGNEAIDAINTGAYLQDPESSDDEQFT